MPNDSPFFLVFFNEQYILHFPFVFKGLCSFALSDSNNFFI